MKASAEISMYPLTENYEPPILDFIKRLNEHPNLTINTNNMSTQIHGEYDDLMAALTKEMKTTFAGDLKVSMVIKLLNTDLK